MKFYYDEAKNELVVTDQGNGSLPEVEVHEEYNEKHTPNIRREDDKLYVSLPHGMSDEHYIDCFVYVHDGKVSKEVVRGKDVPEATFEDLGHGTVYSYCNLHGIYGKEC